MGLFNINKEVLKMEEIDRELLSQEIGTLFVEPEGINVEREVLRKVYDKLDNRMIREIARSYKVFKHFDIIHELVYLKGWEALNRIEYEKLYNEAEREVLEWLVEEKDSEQYEEIVVKVYMDEKVFYKLVKEVEEMELPASMALELISTEAL